MTLEQTWHGHTLVAKLLGEIAFFDSDGLGEALQSIIASRPTLVVLDLSGVEYLGSIGTSLLIRLVQGLRNRGAGVVLAGANPTVRSVLHTVRMQALVRLEDSVEAVLHRAAPQAC